MQLLDIGSVHERSTAIFSITLAQYAPAAVHGEEDRIMVSARAEKEQIVWLDVQLLAAQHASAQRSTAAERCWLDVQRIAKYAVCGCSSWEPNAWLDVQLQSSRCCIARHAGD
jgi:hypothetical protein